MKVANAVTAGVGSGAEAVPRVASVSTSQVVKKSGGANKAACAAHFSVFMAVCRLYAFLTVS